MKIIQWYDTFNYELGGAPTSILALAEGMKDVESEVIVNAVRNFPLIQKHSENVSIRSFLPYEVFYSTKLFLLPYKLLLEYIRFKNKKEYLENTKYDILNVNGPTVNWRFIEFDKVLHKPFLQKITNFKFVNKPKLLTLRGMPSDLTNNPIDIYNEKRMIEMFDNIICVDKNIYYSVMKHIKSKNLKKNVWFIPNFVDTSIFKYTIPSHNEKLKILFIGRLDPSRGLDLVYRLIKNLPNYVELYIIGSAISDKLEKFKRFIAGRENIKFYPNIPNRLIPKYIERCDVVLNPVKIEGISRVSLESLSCGRPVIMLNIGDRYPTIHGKTGYLIKEDINELLSLLEYINNNKNELEELGKNGRNIIEKEYSKEAIIPRIKKVYENILEEK